MIWLTLMETSWQSLEMGCSLKCITPRLLPSIYFGCIYCIYFSYLSIDFVVTLIFLIFLGGWFMDDMILFGFTDGASQHTRNLASTAWVIYYPSCQLLVSRGICIGLASNNVAEYTVVVNLLSEAISLGVGSLVVYLDSQLVVSQLNNISHVRDPYLYRLFLRVCLLQISFNYITYIHIPRS